MAKGAPPQSPWLVGRGFDLVVYAGSSLWAALLVLGLSRWVEPVQIFYAFNIVFTIAHYAPTWLRAYADREERARHRVSVYLFPVAMIGFAVATRGRPEVLAFILYFWDRWHAVMQNYGFMRLYDAKAGTASPRRGKRDLALLITTSLLIMSLNMGLFAPMLEAVQNIGLSPVTSVAMIRAIQIGAGIAAAISAAAWLYELRQVPRGERGRQAPRALFLVMLCAGHGLMNTTTNIFLLNSHEKVYHSLQYVALGWHYGHRRAERTPEATTGGWFRAVFAGHRWPLYAAVIVGWTAVVALANHAIGSRPTGSGLFTIVISVVAPCHYFFDSFLWRVRRPDVRASL